jgi:hypothetical protein
MGKSVSSTHEAEHNFHSPDNIKGSIFHPCTIARKQKQQPPSSLKQLIFLYLYCRHNPNRTWVVYLLPFEEITRVRISSEQVLSYNFYLNS